MLPIILASSSAYRAQILKKLAIPFFTDSPDIDESPLLHETVQQQVARLAIAKAQAVAAKHPAAYIIGSDQLACFAGRALGKPGDFEQANTQLSMLSSQKVQFYTGLCLLNSTNLAQQVLVEEFSVQFKILKSSQIRRYLEIEQPFDCAGSFKSEGLGIALFNKLQGRDPNTLVGLPLIALVEMFNNWGIDVFDYMHSS
ncbi:MAG: septum formation inhibitor Maf [Paraglaciecola sp.]|nr:septum formation inhibitor Maf [Paraglaciecola sp.]NCT48343.1 septum formation inhibitor Maf [Paraglaciecola sp.]